MELNNSKIFYLKTSKLDNIIYSFITLLLSMLFIINGSIVTDLKSYLNRRILLKLLINNPNKLVYMESFDNKIDFKFFGYTITYNIPINSFKLSKYNEIFYIHYFDRGDAKIVAKIIDILNKKYHEHQQELMFHAEQTEQTFI